VSQRSWNHPSVTIFTVSNPEACVDPATGNLYKGVGTQLIILRSGARPDWQAVGPTPGRVYQAEGNTQAAEALESIGADKSGGYVGDTAVVTTLGIDPKPFQQLGVTSCFCEVYAQAGDEPYGDIARMRWQAKQDGWQFVVPTLGIYDEIALSHYFPLNGGAKNFALGHWKGGPLAFYLGEGLTDTGSWPTLATLFP
jgi:hypothetical protein